MSDELFWIKVDRNGPVSTFRPEPGPMLDMDSCDTCHAKMEMRHLRSEQEKRGHTD